MAGYQEHISQAQRNLEYRSSILISGYRDWQEFRNQLLSTSHFAPFTLGASRCKG